jgi:enterochelin esterase-like enzyme
VFYLLHGGGDEDSGWSTIGRAGFILDNLVAAGDAEPMIIVMPNGSLPQADAINDDVEQFWIVVGSDHFARPGSVTLSDTLKEHGIEHEFIETGGGHTWLNWRQYLHDFSQVLFR